MNTSSRRLKRMERMHQRGKRRGGMNLISLMDIFTILVFFLLVNSGEVQVLPNAKALELPESAAEKKPKETLVVVVNHESITLKGRAVVDLSQPMAEGNVIPELQDELQRYASAARRDDPELFKGEITIMGDKNIPYTLLKKVMATCAESEYPQISLALLRRMPQSEEVQTL